MLFWGSGAPHELFVTEVGAAPESATPLRGRGVGDPAAILTAEAAITVFRVGFERWVAQGNRKPLRQLIRESLDELRVITAV